VGGDPKLEVLQRRMEEFYRRPELRRAYQEFIDEREALDHPFERALAAYLGRYRSVLEIGCGSGRLYRTLRRAGYAGRYTGIEIAEDVIERCRRRHPEAEWKVAGAYAIPEGDHEACFSYGVLESLVYPRKALEEMARAVRRDLVLLFPDFIESGHLGSQQAGVTPARHKRRPLDVVVGWYDRKLRLPRALRRARRRLGPFIINLAPVALEHPQPPEPDYDAVYLSCKADIEEWAADRGDRVEYPLGRTLPKALRARSWAFAVVRKSVT
jgi:SAM-dependent methyltransferase